MQEVRRRREILVRGPRRGRSQGQILPTIIYDPEGDEPPLSGENPQNQRKIVVRRVGGRKQRRWFFWGYGLFFKIKDGLTSSGSKTKAKEGDMIQGTLSLVEETL